MLLLNQRHAGHWFASSVGWKDTWKAIVRRTTVMFGHSRETGGMYGHSRETHKTSCWTCGQPKCLKMYKHQGGGCRTPHCSDCKMFGHRADVCPKAVDVCPTPAARKGAGRQRLSDVDKDELMHKIFAKWPAYATELLESEEKLYALFTLSKQRIESLINSPMRCRHRHDHASRNRCHGAWLR